MCKVFLLVTIYHESMHPKNSMKTRQDKRWLSALAAWVDVDPSINARQDERCRSQFVAQVDFNPAHYDQHGGQFEI
jgi:hypothetical protein